MKLSIIVPVYNVEKYLAQCLDSLVGQTVEDYEIIVVNDGSPDNSQRIIDDYAARYPGLIVPMIKENGGLSSARNLGMNVAKGEFIGFVDSDDWVDETMYEKMLEAIERENADIAYCDMEDYYAAWVHQIKAPIAVMQVLLQQEDTGQNRELKAELFRVEQYAEMALSYVRLNERGGGFDLVAAEYALDPVIRKAIRKYAGQFIRKKIQVVYQGTDEVVLTDEKWLSFIVEQILSNAVKYTQQGSVTIRVEGDRQLVIEDTGIGIAAEDIPRIFEKGYTGENGRLGKKSTGIGLYLSRKILRKLGHEITVDSQVDKGTEVRMSLWKKDLEMY